MKHTYPDGPCEECGSLVSLESFEYNEPGGRHSLMLCNPCWTERTRLKEYYINQEKIYNALVEKERERREQ
jgi:hypothetical protein